LSSQIDGRPVVPGSGRLRPLGISEVEIVNGFWAERQEVNSSATIAHCHHWMERLGWVGNFAAANEGRLPQDRNGVVFTDSDVYKLMEAAAWETGRSGSTDSDERFRALTEIIAPAQEGDGYLNTVFGRAGQGSRYSDLEWGHELYCYGHMIQAAVARARTGRTDLFVEVAKRAADHVCATFGAGGIEKVGGHPEIELGLVELARVTGEERKRALMVLGRKRVEALLTERALAGVKLFSGTATAAVGGVRYLFVTGASDDGLSVFSLDGDVPLLGDVLWQHGDGTVATKSNDYFTMKSPALSERETHSPCS